MESLAGCRVPDGHPLFVLYKENDAIRKKLASVRDGITFEDDMDAIQQGLCQLRDMEQHYRKLSDHVFPVVDGREEFRELTTSMTEAQTSILREIAVLCEDEQMSDEEWEKSIADVLDRARDVLGKEDNVLLPLLSQMLTEEEWIGIYFGIRQLAPCFIDRYAVWLRAEFPNAPRCACAE